MEPTERPPEWYRETYPLLFERLLARDRDLDERHQQAWEWAKKAADLLKDSFSAHRVVIFGSLTNRKLFHISSDIDIAAWGIPTERYFAAVGAVTALVKGFEVDLITPDTSKIGHALHEAIEREGIEI